MLPVGFGECLVEAAGLLGMQVLGVGDHEASLVTEDDLAGLERAQPREALFVDHPVAALGDSEQIRVIRRRERTNEVKRGALDQILVVLGVLAGVVDQGELTRTGPGAVGDRAEAGDEFVDHLGELGDIWAVAGIGVGDERDAAVSGHDEPETNEAQVGAFLFGVASLGDRGAVVARVDVGREVRHVQYQPRQVDGEDLDHAGDDAPFDLDQLVRRDGVHRVPKPAVIERCSGQPHPPVAGGLGPPLGERQMEQGSTKRFATANAM